MHTSKYKVNMQVLIIHANEDKNSFCAALANSIYRGCIAAQNPCNIIHIADINFDPILHKAYKYHTPPEPDVLEIQQQIKKSSHVVLVFPIWWGTYPALFKGFIDRVFVPDFAFKYNAKGHGHQKLLKGKQAALVCTMDTPHWYYRYVYKREAYYAVKKSLLEFCGFSKIKYMQCSRLKKSTKRQREKWIKKAFKLGLRLK
jgi:putative NADPH-quinone reductase